MPADRARSRNSTRRAAADIVIGAARHLALMPDLVGEGKAERRPWPVPFESGIDALLAERARSAFLAVVGDKLGNPLHPERAAAAVVRLAVPTLAEVAVLVLAPRTGRARWWRASRADDEAPMVDSGVLAGPDGPAASLPAEIKLRPGTDWYDFAAKYLDDAVDFDVPADLTPEQTAAVQRTSCQAFQSLDCRGLARVDFFLGTDADGRDRLVINEVNTMPGFTPISMFPRMWAASGVAYPELVDRLIASALAGDARR